MVADATVREFALTTSFFLI